MMVPNFHDDFGGWPMVAFCLIVAAIGVVVGYWTGLIPFPAR